MWVSYPSFPLREGYDTGLVMMIYNRPQCVKKTLARLAKSNLNDVLIILLDDASDNPETLRLVQDFSIPQVPIIKIFRSRRRDFNIHENLRLAWDLLSEKYHCRHLAVLDSDVIVKPDWLRKIRRLHKTTTELYSVAIVSGFDACISHPRYKNYPLYKVKKTLGGANMFFDAALYRELIRPCLIPHWDWAIVKLWQEKSYPFLVTRPSVVQHVGYKGLFGKGYWGHDFALNYSLGTAIFLLPAYVFQKTMSAFRFYRKKVKTTFGG